MELHKFQLYMMFDEQSALGYPYIAIGNSCDRYLFIDNDHISIEVMHKNDKVEFYKQYVATSRYIDFDVEKLDSIIERIIGQRGYSLIVNFNENKEMVIAYRHQASDEYRECELSLNNSTTPEAIERVSVINKIMIDIRNITIE